MLDGWKDLANLIQVTYDGEGLVYSVAGTREQQNEASRLEFGDEETAPTGFLRKLANQQSYSSGLTMARVLNQEVPVA